MVRSGRSMERWGLGAILALIALVFQVAAPPGFMVSPSSAGPALVICTGHGPLTLDSHAGVPGHKPARPAHDGICAFAGHGVAASPPTLTILAASPLILSSTPPRRSPDLVPGRGLAAPPPPSQAPPVLI
jgi:hypothetical protein